MDVIIVMLIPLFPLAIAFFSGALQAKQIYVNSGGRSLVLILFLAMALAMMAVVVPCWANRGTGCYPASLHLQILVCANLTLLITSKFAAKIGQKRDSTSMKIIGASAMLAIPTTLPLLLVFENFLVAYFEITLTP